MKRKLLFLTFSLSMLLTLLPSAFAEPGKQASSFPRPGEPRTPLPDDIVIAAKTNRVVLPEQKSGLARLGANAAAVLGQDLSTAVPAFVMTDTLAAHNKAVTENKILVALVVDSTQPISQKEIQQLSESPVLSQFSECAVFVVADTVKDKAAVQLADGIQATRVPVLSILISKSDHITEQTQTVGYLDGAGIVQAVKDGILTAALSTEAPEPLKANPLAACPALAKAPAKLF